MVSQREQSGPPRVLPIEHMHGFLVYAAGITRRSVRTRLREHSGKYMCGDYTVLEIAGMCAGVRKEVWHGWGWTEAKRAEFARRREDIVLAARQQLAGFRIFVGQFDEHPRVIERVEAAIMAAVYRLPSPLCDVADKGMHLAPRREIEPPIRLYNRRSAIIYGLPDVLEI